MAFLLAMKQWSILINRRESELQFVPCGQSTDIELLCISEILQHNTFKRIQFIGIKNKRAKMINKMKVLWAKVCLYGTIQLVY